MLVPFELLSSVTGTTFAGSDAPAEYKLPQDKTTDSNDSSDQLKYQLWKSDITPFKDEKELEASNELNRLIQQVRAIEFTTHQQKPEPLIVPGTITSTEPNKDSSIPVTPKEKKAPAAEPKPPFTPVSEKTLQTLGNLSHNLKTIDNPFKLGEILFLNGNLKEAAVFYQEALNRIDPNETDSAMDRAWLIFQKANCFRNDDKITAANLYGQLVTEYPGSLWAELAQIQSQIIIWYQKEEPQKLIDEINKRDFGKQ